MLDGILNCKINNFDVISHLRLNGMCCTVKDMLLQSEKGRVLLAELAKFLIRSCGFV